MRYRTSLCAHASRVCSTLRNKCVFIAAVAVAALLLMPAAARAAPSSSLPSRGFLSLLLSPPRRWARPIYIRPRELRARASRRGLPLIKRARECTRTRRTHARTRVSFIKGAAGARARIARTQKRRAYLVALTIRPPTYEISRFIIIPVSAFSLSFSVRLLPSPLASFPLLPPRPSVLGRPFSPRATASSPHP